MKMESNCVQAIFVGFMMVVRSWTLSVSAAGFQHVLLGSNVTLDCNISYLYDTTWLKHNEDRAPTAVLTSGLRSGRPFQESQLNPRFSVNLMNRSLVLMISSIEEQDLGLYYCIAKMGTGLTVGKGTVLQSPHSLWLQPWFCVLVSLGLLIKMLTVCTIQCKITCTCKTNT